MTTAYVQRYGNDWLNINCFAAQTGFTQKGVFVEGFQGTEVDALPLEGAETIVHGGVRTVRAALARLGAEPPTAQLPAALEGYLGRKFRRGTLGEIRGLALTNSLVAPLFIKPAMDHKAFSGQVVAGLMDLMSSNHLSDELVVTVQPVIPFVSEWRAFVLDDEVLKLSCYTGDSLIFPNADVIRDFVKDFAMEPAAFRAYGADFGVTAQGATLLVELNDAFSLGCYGLAPMAYATMIEARWRQLCGCAGDHG